MLESGSSYGQSLDQKLSLRNAYGQWYIDYLLGEETVQVEVHIYNMSGQEIISPVSFSANNAGSYQIEGIEDLRGIYLIQVRSNDKFVNKTVKL